MSSAQTLPMLKRVLLVVGSVLLIDQIVKIYIKLNFRIGERFPVLKEVFEIHFIENKGMAFGMEIPSAWGKIALSLFRIVAVVVISLYLRRIIREGAHKGFVTCVALILAGAVGNIIDSAFYGMLFSTSSIVQAATLLPPDGGYAPFLHGDVVDMLHFTVKWPSWLGGNGINEIFPPIFNIADAAITVGVIWILIRQRVYFAKPEEEKSEEPEVAGNSEEGAVQA